MSERSLDWRFVAELGCAATRFGQADADAALKEAMHKMLRRLACSKGAVVAVHRVAESEEEDPLQGWRVCGLWNTGVSPEVNARARRWMRRETYRDNAHSHLAVAEAGQRRAWRLRARLTDEEWNASLAATDLLRELTIADEIVCGEPLDATHEVIVMLTRLGEAPLFTPSERDFASACVAQLHSTLRRWCLLHGYLGAERSLSAREVDVLRQLIRGRSKSEIAEQLELADRSIHHVTVSLFRKFGVHSQRELLARFLTACTPASE